MLGLYGCYIRVMLGLYWGYMVVILGLYRGYMVVILGLYWGYIGVIWLLYWGYIGVIWLLYYPYFQIPCLGSIPRAFEPQTQYRKMGGALIGGVVTGIVPFLGSHGFVQLLTYTP